MRFAGTFGVLRAARGARLCAGPVCVVSREARRERLCAAAARWGAAARGPRRRTLACREGACARGPSGAHGGAPGQDAPRAATGSQRGSWPRPQGVCPLRMVAAQKEQRVGPKRMAVAAHRAGGRDARPVSRIVV